MRGLLISPAQAAEVIPMRAGTEWMFWLGIALILMSTIGFLWREFTIPRRDGDETRQQ